MQMCYHGLLSHAYKASNAATDLENRSNDCRAMCIERSWMLSLENGDVRCWPLQVDVVEHAVIVNGLLQCYLSTTR
ncbi:hypothetical protein PC116_g12397 [Phytophthora cactorum]|uniref:Uncharacterized protein n=1 Tax=Phytophthora cactorum TaxID=29920 RepID=A0A8T1FC45_9STRA|nr:hypothetical protein PC111_g20782 [Phytophthora cactorum]KAG2832269.1 hypothetical protein PC112_g6956 [Phytophthora cactorum]KAG2861653.1 hypothetical protein PC113_g6984 [Phytophthora cactorum]KAG2885623.1 hypothetical protein PC115_g20944 [Phytophthora cactorum]KAG2923092.1 hypothetical protein PC117_g15808 [Phytophthora cactorum]